eukprot:TRINITY_DN5273_c0_g1_i1.p1 TRINITY_DN5273_c0_g1~~TRINITY_DN5273_c0_g1_i1.p1  ORF type:complete len:321 (-),score=91.38 TRINITY_DN5273_c0_g1_i1:440-1402(-)
MLRSLVGSEMCIRDSINAEYGGNSGWGMSEEFEEERIHELQRDIQHLEAAVKRVEKKQKLTPSQEQLLTDHLLAQSTEALASAFEEEDAELDAQYGDEQSYEQQISTLASLSGISFSSIRSDTLEMKNGLSRQLVLMADTTGLSFEIRLMIQEPASDTDAAYITSAQLAVPDEFRNELSGLIECTEHSRAVTTMIRGMARYSQAVHERGQMFREIKKEYPEWIVFPHGTNAASLLSVRPPSGSAAPFVFDFLWGLEVTATGALKHTTELIPRVSKHFVRCDENNVVGQLPAQFKNLVVAKGLQGALEIMMAVVSNPGVQE